MMMMMKSRMKKKREAMTTTVEARRGGRCWCCCGGCSTEMMMRRWRQWRWRCVRETQDQDDDDDDAANGSNESSSNEVLLTGGASNASQNQRLDRNTRWSIFTYRRSSIDGWCVEGDNNNIMCIYYVLKVIGIRYSNLLEYLSIYNEMDRIF